MMSMFGKDTPWIWEGLDYTHKNGSNKYNWCNVYMVLVLKYLYIISHTPWTKIH